MKKFHLFGHLLLFITVIFGTGLAATVWAQTADERQPTGTQTPAAQPGTPPVGAVAAPGVGTANDNTAIISSTGMAIGTPERGVVAPLGNVGTGTGLPGSGAIGTATDTGTQRGTPSGTEASPGTGTGTAPRNTGTGTGGRSGTGTP